MTYFWGFVQAVPTANKDAYTEHAQQAWPIFRKLGALRAVECWGEDIPKGRQTDFYRATQCKEDETPVSFLDRVARQGHSRQGRGADAGSS